MFFSGLSLVWVSSLRAQHYREGSRERLTSAHVFMLRMKRSKVLERVLSSFSFLLSLPNVFSWHPPIWARYYKWKYVEIQSIANYIHHFLIMTVYSLISSHWVKGRFSAKPCLGTEGEGWCAKVWRSRAGVRDWGHLQKNSGPRWNDNQTERNSYKRMIKF